MNDKLKPRNVEVVRLDYQPSKAELEADVRVATFAESVEALTRPVRIRHIDRPKPSK